jgi:hypothetical protein
MTDPDLSLDLTYYQSKDPDQALAAALAAVRSYCGWHIAPSLTTTVDVWSPDGSSLFLNTRALTSITSVVQDAVTLPATSYIFDSFGVVSRTPGSYFSRLSRSTVTFVHGYTALPADVEQVVLGLAQRSINDTRGLVARPGTGQGVILMEGHGPQLDESDKARLTPYAILAGFA